MDVNLNIIPSLAKSFFSADHMTWAFHSRGDVFFHDENLFVNAGRRRRMTASDVEFSFSGSLIKK